MRKWIALLLISAAVTISAAPPADVHAAIRHYREALKAKDLAALDAIWTDDYVFVNATASSERKRTASPTSAPARHRSTRSPTRKRQS